MLTRRRVYAGSAGAGVGWIAAAILLASFVQARPALAQTAPRYRWIFEVHGTGTFGSSSSGGAAMLPARGATFQPVPGGPVSRDVPSWALGDGAALFNEVAANRGLTQRIVPLDPILTTRIMRQPAAIGFGGRLSRRISSRVDLEFSVDFSYRHGEFTGAVRPALDATRASYQAAFDALFASQPLIFRDPSVDVATTYHDGTGMEAIGTGTINVRFGTGGWRPYICVGGGVVAGFGTFPSATLSSDYRFRLAAPVPEASATIHQTETVVIRQNVPARPLFVVGGGLIKDLSQRLGVRADVRLYLAAGAPDTKIETTATSITNGQVGLVYPFAAPVGLVFSSTRSLRSSLGTSVSTTTFQARGARVISTLTFGLFVKM